VRNRSSKISGGGMSKIMISSGEKNIIIRVNLVPNINRRIEN